MYSKTYDLVEESFEVGYRTQEYWGWKIALAFFFGEVGAGFFFVSAFYDFMAGMLVGWAMATFFKPAALFMHLGKPLRSWRAVIGLRTSWISRGVCVTVLYTGFAGIHMLNLKFHIFSGLLGDLIYVVALLACFWVMIYLGFVLSYSPSIALWDTALMPVISLSYGLLGGVTLTLLAGVNSFLADSPETTRLLKTVELGLVLFCAVILMSFLHGAAYGSGAGRKSVTLLLKEKFVKWFIPFVVIIGIVVTALLTYFGPATITILLATAIAELIGDIGLKILLFKAGTYEPVLSHIQF